MNFEKEILSNLQNSFELIAPEIVSKETILAALKIKISEMLQGNAESFFQTLYRIDIPENKSTQALQNPSDAIDTLAMLIYERQLQKAISREAYKREKNEIDKDIIW